MIEAIVPALIVLISLIGVKKREDNDFLSIEQGNALKGIAALLLVVVHIRERLEVMPVAYRILAGGGGVLISIDFFLLFWLRNCEEESSKRGICT